MVAGRGRAAAVGGPRRARRADLKEALLDDVDSSRPLDAVSESGGRLNAARALLGPRPGAGSAAARPGGAWASCDPDHDGVRDGDDECPDQPGTFATAAARTRDDDGLRRPDRQLPRRSPTPSQADADGDGVGDACDPTPRGDDRDGDGHRRPRRRVPDRLARDRRRLPGRRSPPPTADPRPDPPTPTPTPPAPTRRRGHAAARQGLRRRCAKGKPSAQGGEGDGQASRARRRSRSRSSAGVAGQLGGSA